MPQYKIHLAKNGLVILLALMFYPLQARALAAIQPDQLNNFLLVISMLLVTVCFANFAFTYHKGKSGGGFQLLAHASTFVFMVLIALLLESTALVVKAVYPAFTSLIFIYAILLYAGVVLYDFWDFSAAE